VENAYRLVVRKPEEKRQLGRPRRRRVDNIKLNLGEMGWVVWTALIWFRIGTNERSRERGNEP
jgi:hypothetical protein